jgi:hypothetical protein
VKPLAEWIDDASTMSETEFFAKHREPFLVHWSSPSGRDPNVRDNSIATFERFVLTPRPNTIKTRSMIENYRVGVLKTERSTKQVWVGYSDRCDIVIDDSSVSRVHAYFFQENGWHVKDAESSAGTLLNDLPPTGEALVSGDRITLGGVDLVFLEPVQLFQLIHRIELF